MKIKNTLMMMVISATRQKHGMFTYHLLKKLQQTGGNVTYGQLADYLTQTVSVESLRINGKEQDPTVNVGVNLDKNWENWKIY